MDGFSARRKTGRKELVSAILAIALSSAIAIGVATDHIPLALALSLLPLLLLTMVASFGNKKIAFFLLMVINFLIPVSSHYIHTFSTGLMMDGMIVFCLFVILSQNLNRRISLKKIPLDVVFVVGVWLLYCFIEAFNPRMLDVGAWYKSIRNMALYFFLIVVMVPIVFENFNDVKQFLLLWSVFIIIATLKAVYQRYIGFTPGDNYFLYEMGGSSTHIIYYGIRYFSIFSDASNFSGCMGMASVIFLMAGLYAKSAGMRWYMLFICAISIYCVIISGTRSALVVPVIGIFLAIILIKNIKLAIPVGLALATAFCLLAFTTIGQSNMFIRRARTVFDRREDLSYLTRIDNRKKLTEFLATMPMGNSLGMSGGRGKEYGDESPIAGIPTDSWLVQVWVETGYVGQAIYFLVMIYLFLKAAIIIFFRLKNPEVRAIAAGMLSGVVGLFAMSALNEVFTQYPNGILVYTCLSIVFISPLLEKQINEEETAHIADNDQL